MLATQPAPPTSPKRISHGDVLQARNMFHAGGVTVADLCKQFNVSYQTMYGLLRGHTFKSVGGPIIGSVAPPITPPPEREELSRIPYPDEEDHGNGFDKLYRRNMPLLSSKWLESVLSELDNVRLELRGHTVEIDLQPELQAAREESKKLADSLRAMIGVRRRRERQCTGSTIFSSTGKQAPRFDVMAEAGREDQRRWLQAESEALNGRDLLGPDNESGGGVVGTACK